MKIRIIAAFIFALSIASCKNESSSFPKLDLLQYGLPIDIKAPADAKVTADDLGVMKDVSIKSGDNYFVQIFMSEATLRDAKKLLAEQKAEVEASEFFSKMVLEDENGFVFEKKIGERINYDFRHVKIIGDSEYKYQTGLFGTFSEEDVKAMYNAVK